MNNYLDEEDDPKTKLSPIPYILGIVILGLSFVFKIMHWPGGSLFKIIGTLLFIIYSFYGVANKSTRNPINVFLSILSLIYIIYLFTLEG